MATIKKTIFLIKR